jgi:diaminopimelate decarboxylase
MTAQGIRTGRQSLCELMVSSDRLAVSADGMLLIEGQSAAGLLAEFGSPLYVAVEATIRENYRRIVRAFADRWQADVNVMYAIKTNNNLAIRAVLSSEGAGGDCFGLGELHATIRGGTDLRRVVMNGSNKTADEIAAALRHGIVINIDGEEEIELAQSIAAAASVTARVNLRLKLLPPELDAYSGEFFKTSGGIREAVRRSKWGYTLESAAGLVCAIRGNPNLDLCGYSCHVGRFSAHPDAYALVGRALGDAVIWLHGETGFWPTLLDIGGGWARQREPESRAPDLNPFTIEDYAEAATQALGGALAQGGLSQPKLWLEPGRYIVGNAVLLLAKIGAVKHDDGLRWVHVDASTNDLMRIETSKAWYHILPASRMDTPMDATAEIVGGTCIPSILGSERSLPELRPGDCVAILDAGMYAETIANQFNAIPRPATILVSPAGAEVIKRRETVEDLFATHVIPSRLGRDPA